jgi:membrane-associated phospholipid phosphatase
MAQSEVTTDEPPRSPDQSPPRVSFWRQPLRSGPGWLTPRAIAIAVWLLALIVFCVVQGIPIDRFQQNLWIMSGIVVVGLGNPTRGLWRMLLDWLPFILLLYLYDFSRGAAEHLGMPVHVFEAIDFDSWVFHGVVPTVWLQAHLYDPWNVHWYDVVGSLVYFSHFVAVWVIAGVLYVRDREQWVRFARRVLVLSFAGLLTFALFPAAPPWWAAQAGDIPPVDRIASRGWDAIGLHIARQVIQQGQGVVNDVAAIPSLHFAFSALICAFFWKSVPAWGKALLALYPLTMAFTLVYAGEHFFLDIVLGALYVAGTVVACNRWERWRSRPRTPRADVVPASQPGQGTTTA